MSKYKATRIMKLEIETAPAENYLRAAAWTFMPDSDLSIQEEAKTEKAALAALVKRLGLTNVEEIELDGTELAGE